jgi:hypothetical protein
MEVLATKRSLKAVLEKLNRVKMKKTQKMRRKETRLKALKRMLELHR